MYSRSFHENQDAPIIPDGYSGTALTCDLHTDLDDENSQQTGALPREKSGILSHILPIFEDRIPIFGRDFLSNFKIGKEEILIIATAAFLFFSEEGDRECAILLLILLFIT